MAIIFIRCPHTGRGISTGIEIEPARFKTLPVFFARSYCPNCRIHHEWFAQEAWLREEEAIE
jgi:hypothetical protein